MPELSEAEHAAYLARPLTIGAFLQMADSMIRGIDGRIAAAILASKRIGKLEDSVLELQARDTTRFRGVWRSGTPYSSGDFTIHKGGLWHCSAPPTDPTFARPNTDEGRGVWQLSVKAGGVSGDSIA